MADAKVPMSSRIGRIANSVAESLGSSLMIWRITFRFAGRSCGKQAS